MAIRAGGAGTLLGATPFALAFCESFMAKAVLPPGYDNPAATEPLEIELRQPWLAALLAWAIPGAGHIYQGRTAKGLLFFVAHVPTPPWVSLAARTSTIFKEANPMMSYLSMFPCWKTIPWSGARRRWRAASHRPCAGSGAMLGWTWFSRRRRPG